MKVATFVATMNKTKPIGVRFDVGLLERLKADGLANTPQKVLNLLTKEFYINHATKNGVHIYQLINPFNKEVFYVGKTEKSPLVRLNGHISESLNPARKNEKIDKINEIIKLGRKPIISTIESIECNSEEDYQRASEREKYWIYYFLESGHPLTNREKDYPKPGEDKNTKKEPIKKVEKEESGSVTVWPKTLSELKELCPPDLSGFDRSLWISNKRIEYGV